MCTAVSYNSGSHYFGRNLDLEYSYSESVTVTPRKYPFAFRKMPTIESHYAMIGMSYIQNGYPLYYDATNEKGLSMAGLSFPYYAEYKAERSDADNIAPFELIPWILSQCKSTEEAKSLLSGINIVDISFREELPQTPLHWMISDKEKSIAVESTAEGLKVYDNPVCVMTNSPTFDYHITNLNNYMGLTNRKSDNSFAADLPLCEYSKGMGAIGLPGDYSSSSRFVKAAFVLQNAVSKESENESVTQFFHVLGSVAHPRGCVELEDKKYQITVYSSCCNTEKGIYYYTTYNNSRITAVDMHKEMLDSEKIISYPIITEQQMFYQN